MSTCDPSVAISSAEPLDVVRLPVPGFRSLRRVDLECLGTHASPVLMLDDFIVGEMTFSPHPHAGFAAVTYVFEDSEVGLRSRASLADDAVVGPGGIVWTEAGRGIVHEELPVEPGRALHGVQLFVNLSAANRLTSPRVLALDGDEVPVWNGPAGDAVRVVVGEFGGVESPLHPIEPFTLLDIDLRSTIDLEVADGHSLVLYVRDGEVELTRAGVMAPMSVGPWQAVMLTPGTTTVTAERAGHLLALGGCDISEPVVVEGSFIMNDRHQIAAAISRYRSGEMGALDAAPH